MREWLPFIIGGRGIARVCRTSCRTESPNSGHGRAPLTRPSTLEQVPYRSPWFSAANVLKEHGHGPAEARRHVFGWLQARRGTVRENWNAQQLTATTCSTHGLRQTAGQAMTKRASNSAMQKAAQGRFGFIPEAIDLLRSSPRILNAGSFKRSPVCDALRKINDQACGEGGGDHVHYSGSRDFLALA